MVKANHGFKYFLTTIDVFTKMAWVYPIKDKNVKMSLNASKISLANVVKKPERLNFDRGSELILNFSREYFKIRNFLTNLPVPQYMLKDYKKGDIVGSFLRDEIINYAPSEIIKQRKTKKRGL